MGPDLLDIADADDRIPVFGGMFSMIPRPSNRSLRMLLPFLE